MALTFLSSNPGKFAELQLVFSSLQQRSLNLDELQSLDAREVIEHKLRQAMAIEPGKYLVEDTSLVVPSLGGLPGTLVKWFLETVGPAGLARMVEQTGETGATAHTWIGYVNEAGAIEFFHGEVAGQIVVPRGEGGFGWDGIFLPDGSTQTFAELGKEGKQKYSMRRQAAEQLARFLISGVDERAQ